MIRIEKVLTNGWEAAMRGMRNPMNSWDKADTKVGSDGSIDIGSNDYTLAMKLASAGSDHRKFLRMIVVSCDITAPLYWWKEFDTYKVGTVANSCSTMHKIMSRPFVIEDFSTDQMTDLDTVFLFNTIVKHLNTLRDRYLGEYNAEDTVYSADAYKKGIWYSLIQLLPSSYNQKRTILMNYENLVNMYYSRKNHKLKEWRDFCNFVEELPYSEIILDCHK